MKKILVLFLFGCLSFINQGVSQTIPFGYDSLTTLVSPIDSINDAAGDLLLSADEKYLVVQYSYNPTYLYFYEVGVWTPKWIIKLSGHNFIYNSYFSEDGKFFYTTESCKMCNPKQINLETGESESISCKKMPKGCDYKTTLKVGDRIFCSDEKYLFVITPDPDFKVEVLVKTE